MLENQKHINSASPLVQATLRECKKLQEHLVVSLFCREDFRVPLRYLMALSYKFDWPLFTRIGWYVRVGDRENDGLMNHDQQAFDLVNQWKAENINEASICAVILGAIGNVHDEIMADTIKAEAVYKQAEQDLVDRINKPLEQGRPPFTAPQFPEEATRKMIENTNWNAQSLNELIELCSMLLEFVNEFGFHSARTFSGHLALIPSLSELMTLIDASSPPEQIRTTIVMRRSYVEHIFFSGKISEDEYLRQQVIFIFGDVLAGSMSWGHFTDQVAYFLRGVRGDKKPNKETA